MPWTRWGGRHLWGGASHSCLLRVPIASSLVPFDTSVCSWQHLCPGEAHTLGGPGLDADVAFLVLGWAFFELSMGPWDSTPENHGAGCGFVFVGVLISFDVVGILLGVGLVDWFAWMQPQQL